MNDAVKNGLPASYSDLLLKCEEIGFTMPSDLYIGSLLKTLIASKPASNLLELGTGIGLTLSWMIDGKYSDLDVTLAMLKTGGFYIIDDMLAQPNWPKGHQDLVNDLIRVLESRKDLQLTKMNWSTGIIIVTKPA